MTTFNTKPYSSANASAAAMTIGQLAKRFGLSRSTLLYYDSIGLLKPSSRSRANYRRYLEKDAGRLEMICMYRQLGLPMKSIIEILKSPKSSSREILEKRLLLLAKEISRLREQQHTIIRMLGDRSLRKRIPVLDKEGWIAILQSCGLDDDAKAKWHQEFEKFSPVLHQEFLEGLGIAGEEIDLIRQLSKI